MKKSYITLGLMLTFARASSPPTYKEIIVRPVLSDHSKTDKTKVLKTNGSLMKVESIAECSLGAFCNTFYLH